MEISKAPIPPKEETETWAQRRKETWNSELHPVQGTRSTSSEDIKPLNVCPGGAGVEPEIPAFALWPQRELQWSTWLIILPKKSIPYSCSQESPQIKSQQMNSHFKHTQATMSDSQQKQPKEWPPQRHRALGILGTKGKITTWNV